MIACDEVQGLELNVHALAQLLPQIPEWQLLGVHPQVTEEDVQQTEWHHMATFRPNSQARSVSTHMASADAEAEQHLDAEQAAESSAPLQPGNMPTPEQSRPAAPASAAAAQQLAQLRLDGAAEPAQSAAQAHTSAPVPCPPEPNAHEPGHHAKPADDLEDDLDALLQGPSSHAGAAVAPQTAQHSAIASTRTSNAARHSGQQQLQSGMVSEDAPRQAQVAVPKPAPASARDELEDWLDL